MAATILELMDWSLLESFARKWRILFYARLLFFIGLCYFCVCLDLIFSSSASRNLVLLNVASCMFMLWKLILLLICYFCTWIYPDSIFLCLTNACSRLSELALLYCQRIEPDALSEIGKGCAFLQALHLVDCSGIGDDSMCSIAKGCKNLKKLHIRRCYEVSIIFFF